MYIWHLLLQYFLQFFLRLQLADFVFSPRHVDSRSLAGVFDLVWPKNVASQSHKTILFSRY